MCDKKPSKPSQLKQKTNKLIAFLKEHPIEVAGTIVGGIVGAIGGHYSMRLVHPHTPEQAAKLLIEAQKPHGFLWHYFNGTGVSAAYCYQYMNNTDIQKDLTCKFVVYPIIVSILWSSFNLYTLMQEEETKPTHYNTANLPYNYQVITKDIE